MEGSLDFSGIRLAFDFIATRFGALMAMPQDARPVEWRRIYTDALQAGLITPADGWPPTYSEAFCLCTLQNLWWATLDRLPPQMAAALDDMDDAPRAAARELAEFLIAHIPGMLPRPDRQAAWRALCAQNVALLGDFRDSDAPLAAVLAQAILVERHLRARQTVH